MSITSISSSMVPVASTEIERKERVETNAESEKKQEADLSPEESFLTALNAEATIHGDLKKAKVIFLGDIHAGHEHLFELRNKIFEFVQKNNPFASKAPPEILLEIYEKGADLNLIDFDTFYDFTARVQKKLIKIDLKEIVQGKVRVGGWDDKELYDKARPLTFQLKSTKQLMKLFQLELAKKQKELLKFDASTGKLLESENGSEALTEQESLKTIMASFRKGMSKLLELQKQYADILANIDAISDQRSLSMIEAAKKAAARGGVVLVIAGPHHLIHPNTGFDVRKHFKNDECVLVIPKSKDIKQEDIEEYYSDLAKS